MAYETTSVAVEKSQADLRKLLARSACQRFSFHGGRGDDGKEWAAMEFVYAQDFERPTLVRIAVPLKIPSDKALTIKYPRRDLDTVRAQTKAQEERRIWRVIFYSLKSRMEAVDEGVETFEQAFLPHIVDPSTNATVWSLIRGSVESGVFAIGGRGLPALTSGDPA